MDSTPHVWLHAFEENSMTPLERLPHCVSFRTGIIVAALMALALSSTAARPVELAMRATDYNWRTCEAKLNALPQFITEIDGLDIHFHSRVFEA
jgi:hypothetical protein